jgi:hypothetical protein
VVGVKDESRNARVFQN